MKIFQIYKKFPWAVIGGLLTLGSILLALYFGLHEKKPNISYEIISETNVLDVRKPLKDLSIFFKEEDIQKENLNLLIFTIRIKNDGEVHILQEQYDAKDIWGTQIKNAKIIEVRLINSNSDYIKSKLEPKLIDDDKIKLNKIIFEKGKYFVLEILVLHPKASLPEIIPMGKIAGIEKIVPTKTWVKEGKQSFLTKLFFGNFPIHLTRFLVYIIVTTLVGLIMGMSISGISSYREKRKRKLRKTLIEVFYEKKALEDNGAKREIFNIYIEFGEMVLKRLSKLLETEHSRLAALKVQTYNFLKEYRHKRGETLEIIPPYYYGKHMEHMIFAESPMTYLLGRLIDKNIVKLEDSNKVVIQEDFKRELINFINFLEEVKKKKIKEKNRSLGIKKLVQ
jgi:hypothetical protein